LFKQLSSGKTKWYMLLCYGGTGCGKTHLCQSLALELRKQGKYTTVINWESIISILKNCMNSEAKDSYEVQLTRYCKSERLIVDDVGMGTTGSNWEWGVFDDLINQRYTSGLLTVCTTNLDIKELPDRAVSRFRDTVNSRIVLNFASDYRPSRKTGGLRNETKVT